MTFTLVSRAALFVSSRNETPPPPHPHFAKKGVVEGFFKEILMNVFHTESNFICFVVSIEIWKKIGFDNFGK